MSAVRLGTRFALCAGLGLILVGCGSAPAEETSGGAGSNVRLWDNFPSSAGQSSNDGFKGWRNPTTAGSGGAAAGASAAAGSSGSAGKSPAAGSGGTAGAAGAAGAAGSAAAGSGTTAPTEDPFDIFGLGSAGAPAEDPLDLFGNTPGMVSCVGLLCAELADCQNLYPTEHAACKFTQCVDLECK